MKTKKIFVADIGGTNSRFAWFSEERKSLCLKDTLSLSTGGARSFSHLFEQLEQSGFPCKITAEDLVVIAAAGPVQNEKICALTNISWDIDLTTFPLLAHGIIINDFVAQGFACLGSRENNTLKTVQKGKEDPSAPLAVVGAGTGLGHCTLLPSPGGQWLFLASEAGSTIFPFTGETEQAFADFASKKCEQPILTADNIVSGRGLCLVHEFFTGQALRPEEFIEKIDLSSPTTALFSRFYGRACRQYALTVMPRGGLFVSGGIAIKNPFFLEHKNFLEEFQTTHKHAAFLRTLPIFLQTEKEPGLTGAAIYAQKNLLPYFN